jgi:hypothetical protein
MTYIIKCNNDWVLFRNVPSNYTRFDLDRKGWYLKCGKEIVRGELLQGAPWDQVEALVS